MVRRQIARLRSRKGVRPFLDRSTHLNWIAHSAQASEGRIVQTRPAVLVARKRRAQLHVTFVASGTGEQGHAIRKKSDTAVEPTPARRKSRDRMKRARGSIDRAQQGSMVAHSCNRAQAAVGLCRVRASSAQRKTTREFSRKPFNGVLPRIGWRTTLMGTAPTSPPVFSAIALFKHVVAVPRIGTTR